jgi:hypothetical protein
MYNSHKSIGYVVLTSALVVGFSNAYAAEDFFGTGFNRHFTFRVSGFQASTNTDIRVDSKTGVIGSNVSFEDDLGLSDRETQPLIDITYRFNSRHMLDFSYIDLSRSASKIYQTSGTTTDDILWTAGAELSGSFDSEVYRLSYGYSFINDGEKELGILLGLHVTRLNLTLTGTGSLVAIDPTTGNEVVLEGEAQRTYDSGFTLPLPVIGLHGTYAFSAKFRVRGWGQVFSLNYDDYEGTLINAAGMLEYDLFENFGVGGGYALYSYDLDMDSSDYKGSFSYDFKGPTLFVYAAF